ncbi:GNAT family N-acetyltransferase [Ectobacillus sp. JY-23]|uniref:GNAT family N-acetyltransferase n=1 Tax=Ectobacillus sp. JY-23 TaxID=2933872 RepID=UPI001FF412B8|nr:GNAT family protein [Ectobacillus sp. JY-23]UOY92492.1 GNAT family N-acetyltransferase [Ectobacillus sp. JY-23]
MYTYTAFHREDLQELIMFLTSETWSFHGQSSLSEEDVRKSAARYTGPGTQTFWITEGKEKVGMIRVFELEDPICMFDLRLRSKHRGKGIGAVAVRWMTDYVFTHYPHIIRIEGHTRYDNLAMRKTLFNSGYVKEAYHRKAWPQGGALFDSIGYAMIREDWETGQQTRIEDPVLY